MGLFDRLRGIGDPVEGEYRLVACSVGSGGAAFENCSMDGVVTAPGVQPTSVHHVSLLTPTSKWPQPGSTLPVTIDRRDPSKLKIRWDAVPSNAQVARSLADEQARRMATGAPAAETTVVGAPGRAVPGAAGGGLTPAESARAAAGGAAGLGLQALTARVLAAHEIAVPPGMPQAPGGTWDLTLDVDAPGGGWSSVIRISFSSPERRADVARIGRALPVLADPDRRRPHRGRHGTDDLIGRQRSSTERPVELLHRLQQVAHERDADGEAARPACSRQRHDRSGQAAHVWSRR